VAAKLDGARLVASDMAGLGGNEGASSMSITVALACVPPTSKNTSASGA
jgi:hypothetical protein